MLSEKQLNILKTCYSANPRPDALMKVTTAHSPLLLGLTYSPFSGATSRNDWTECQGDKSMVPEQKMQGEWETEIFCVNQILLKFFKDKKFQNRMLEKHMQGEKVNILSFHILIQSPEIF